MALAPRLPHGWEERWQREKEQRRRAIEEGGEKLEEANRKLKWIVEFNNRRMGAKGRMQEEGEEQSEEEEVQMHCRHAHPRELFHALEELRASALLTDLTLRTADGAGMHAHSAIMAATCSALRQHLQSGDGGRGSAGERGGGVVEFAYTGAIAGLNRDTLAQIRAAGLALGARRVLELCSVEEEKGGGAEGGTGGGAEECRISAETQMELTLSSVRELWMERLGCDVELEVEGRRFPAHRPVLAACSDYFRGMFCSGMRESAQRVVTLQLVGGEELEALLSCSYSGTLGLGWGGVFELTCSALQLQIQPALLLCLRFLRSRMDARSCLDVAAFAEAYGLADLRKLAEDFLLINFQEVAATPKFLDLPGERLLEVIGCDGLCAASELPVFRAVVAWLEAEPEERLRWAPPLMAAVRFPLMTFREFCEVRAVNLGMEVSGAGEVQLYGSALSQFGFPVSDGRDPCRVRRPKDALILVGGDRLDPELGRRPSRQLWFAHALHTRTGLVKEVEWRLLGEMPEPARFRHGLGVLGGQLYVIGGCHFYAKSDTLKSAYRYDPLKGSWHRLADLRENRSNFSLVVREGLLYAIGGDRDINNNMDSVECYCPDTDCWSLARPLDQPLSGHAAVVWEGEIFVSGGFNCRYECLVSMFLYHPQRGSTVLSGMAGDRALHCMESLRGRLYVAGGVCNLRTYYTDQLACEAYDPRSDAWSSLEPLPLPHVSAASAVLEGRLYVLGGYCMEDSSDTELLHRYHPLSQRWENMGRMPGPNTDIRACLCRLPTHLRQ
ncbi:hypothetical protein MATL_G00199870 [Megalops atlanticus]|uniref:BTB domain-containing protein n=1 Tax=Megalops atlanticus TaxID=7932 RepID=A0A9D3PK79_MEGAT|nr:hypothetical protein MATL_G00199870 [Megalops atlanticus]